MSREEPDLYHLGPVVPPTRHQIAAVVHHVRNHAHDRDDAALLLAALGIDLKEVS